MGQSLRRTNFHKLVPVTFYYENEDIPYSQTTVIVSNTTTLGEFCQALSNLPYVLDIISLNPIPLAEVNSVAKAQGIKPERLNDSFNRTIITDSTGRVLECGATGVMLGISRLGSYEFFLNAAGDITIVTDDTSFLSDGSTPNSPNSSLDEISITLGSEKTTLYSSLSHLEVYLWIRNGPKNI